MAPFGEFLDGLLSHAAVRGMGLTYRTETEDATSGARLLHSFHADISTLHFHRAYAVR